MISSVRSASGEAYRSRRPSKIAVYPRSFAMRVTTPSISRSTRWLAVCSFFASSFCKSSISREASRCFRSRSSPFSRRASAVINGPFFSSSSRRPLSSWSFASTSFCMPAFSRSSCSRAATPAAERAATRWISMNAIFGVAGCAHAGVATVMTAAAASVSALSRALIPPLLERRTPREVERAKILPGLPARVDPVVDTDRPERRLPPDATADAFLQIRQIELRPEPVYVADVEESGEPQAEWQRDDVLRVAQHLARAADPETALILRRHLAELEAPDRVRAAEVEPLEHRQGLVGPAEAVARLDAAGQDVAKPDRIVLRDEGPGLHVLRVATESGELRRQTTLSTLRGHDGIVTTVAAHASRRSRGHTGPHLLDEHFRERGDLAQVADPVARRAVAEVPPPVLEERVAQPEPRAERSIAVLRVLSVVTVEVEPSGERAVEQPRIREADHALLSPAATAQAHRRLPAAPQDVALREVDGADEAVHGREAAAQAEDARGAFGDLDVDDDPCLVGPWLRVDLDLLEVTEVHELLAGPLFLLQRVQVALMEGDLTSEDLVLTPHVAADVDALHEHLGPLVDLDRDVERVLAGDLIRLGSDVHRRAADRAVEVLDVPHALAELRPREHVPALERQLALDLRLGEERDPGELDRTDPELRPLDAARARTSRTRRCCGA